MNPLPGTVVSKERQRQRRQLAAWLREWQADRALRTLLPLAEEGEEAVFSPPAPDRTANASPGGPAPGQVFLLPPASAGSADERPVYVVVVKDAGDEFLIAPFSRFATPAFTGEWRTGLRPKPLRVLSLWNSRVVPAHVLSAGWFTLQVPARKLDEIRRALEGWSGPGGDCPPGPSTASGPPLVHPLDPRHTYLAEESALVEQLIATAACRTRAPLIYEEPRSELRLAAEPRAPYGKHPRKPPDSKGG